MRIHPFKAIIPVLSKLTEVDDFFDTVREEFSTYYKNGYFEDVNEDALYIYQITSPTENHIGLIASLDLEDYRDKKIKKHENTLLEKEKQQMALLLERGAMVKPILLTYKDNDLLHSTLFSLIENTALFYEIYTKKANQHHRFWKISEPSQMELLQALFLSEIPKCYVADGHHRLTTNLLFEETYKQYHLKEKFDDVLCAFFADTQLDIRAFHRILKDVDYDEVTLITQINDIADAIIPAIPTPTHKGMWSMCIKGQWHTWQWKPAFTIAHSELSAVVLDVDMLNELIFKNIFNIQNVRSNPHIGYIEGNKSIADLEKQSHKGILFHLYPVAIEDLMIVSDNDDIMPPKSTFFEPRMLNGLIVQPIPKEYM